MSMGKWNPVIAVLLALVAGSTTAMAASQAQFAQISQALAAGHGAQALGLADTALRQEAQGSADRSRLLLYRGLAGLAQGDRAGALVDLTQAINAHTLPPSEQARAYLERGLLLDGMDRLKDAIGDYGAVLSLVPDSSAALNNRANVFRRQKRFDDAKQDYLASLAAGNPAPEYPYYGLGQIAESSGRPDEARNFYAQALAANPGYALAADRMKALGGAPAPAQAITLRPPKSAAVADAPVVLRPPGRRGAAKPPAEAVAPTPNAAGFAVADVRPGLRPALDNPPETTPANVSGQQAQLGAWRLEAEANDGWARAVKAAGGALSGFVPRIVAVDLPGRGRYYRLRVAAPEATQLCAVLTAKGLDCLAVRE